MTTIEQVNFGSCTSTISRWHFDDIKIVHLTSHFTEPMVFPSGTDDDMVRLHFSLRGEYNFDHQQLNQSFASLGGRQNIMYSNGFNVQVQTMSPEIETFGIQFPKALFVQYAGEASDPLRRFCEAVLDGKSALLSDRWPIVNLQSRKVIDEICQCKYTGAMRKLFLLSKCMELLVLSAAAHEDYEKSKEVFVKNNTDKEKIMAARDLVSKSIQEPPHLGELASLVNINEYKLKRGFKELFNTTVYGYIRELRLQLAQRQLLDTQLTAAEIALQLGYASPQHFNNAFKKKYGITPASLRKQA